MQDGVCPKCGSHEVYVKRLEQLRLPLTAFSQTYPWAYACTNCFYVELYLEDESAAMEIAKHWKHLDIPEKKKRDEL